MSDSLGLLLAMLVLACVALVPMGWALRHGASARGRRDAALELHRAQLDELERERAAGELGAAEYEAAALEIKRRLLRADAEEEAVAEAPRTGWARTVLLAGLILAGGFALYSIAGMPGLPAQPLAARIAQAERQEAQTDALIDELRRRLAGMDKAQEQTRQGYELLGNAEARRGRMAEAAEAWRTALATRFDPTLAAMTGAAIFRAEGKVTEEAAALFRRALAEAPADAPWRPMAENMLKRAAE